MKGASAVIVGHYFIQRPNEIIIKEKKSLTPILMNHLKLYQKTIRVNRLGTIYTIKMTYLVNLTSLVHFQVDHNESKQHKHMHPVVYMQYHQIEIFVIHFHAFQ